MGSSSANLKCSASLMFLVRRLSQSAILNSSAPSSSNGCADVSSCNLRPLCNSSTQQPNSGQEGQGQGKKNVSFDLQNVNFMMEQDPEVLRAEYNLPRDAPISTHYIGETSQQQTRVTASSPP